jgi:AcrR family transcriptional regulator
VQIAERAGVTQRTLFNHFGDMDSLVEAVVRHQFERALELAPTAGEGPLDQRVNRYASTVATLLEEQMDIRWAALSAAAPAHIRGDVMGAVRAWTQAFLRESFSQELAALRDDARREALVAALELQTDPAVWRVRRRYQGQSPDEARQAMAGTMLAVLHAAGSCRRSGGPDGS